LSAGRVYAIRLHLSDFRDWQGRETAVAEIDGNTLLKYQTHLLSNLKSKSWTRTTAQHYLKTVKAFVRWLWQIEAIPSLPRVLDGKAGPLKINANPPSVVVFSRQGFNLQIRPSAVPPSEAAAGPRKLAFDEREAGGATCPNHLRDRGDREFFRHRG
jgi:hypothetical protein